MFVFTARAVELALFVRIGFQALQNGTNFVPASGTKKRPLLMKHLDTTR